MYASSTVANTDWFTLDKTLTPAEFREARQKLGLSQEQLSQLLQVGSGRTVRRWEAGERDIPGPVVVLMHWLAFNQPPSSPDTN